MYRGATGTPDSLTPRPGLDTKGLSANTKPYPGKNRVIDTTKLKSFCVFCDDAEGHVTILPKDISEYVPWMNTRKTGTTHPLTQEIIDASTPLEKKK